jgi:hypothetical protein
MLLSPDYDAISDASRQTHTQGACQKLKPLFLLDYKSFASAQKNPEITF